MSFGDGSEIARDSKSGREETEHSTLSLLSSINQPLLRESQGLLSSQSGNWQGKAQNAAAVYRELLPQIPGAAASQLGEDLKNGSALMRAAESAVLGFGTAVLLARSPVLAKTLLTGAGIAASATILESGIRFTKSALSADSAESRSRLSADALKSLGRAGADLIETAPSFIVGSSSALKLSGRHSFLDSLSSSVRETGEYRIRTIMPERLHYMSLDSKAIGQSGPNGELDLLNAGREMMRRTPWRGVEDGRFMRFDGNTLKMSARLPGTEFETIMGRRAESMFHTHADKLLPTSGDFNSVFDTGLIGVPKHGVLTFYEGSGGKAMEIGKLAEAGRVNEARQAAESLLSGNFKSMVIDPAKELSVRVELRWNQTLQRLEPLSIEPLNYADTVKNLSKWKGRLDIGSIESSSEGHLSLGMQELLRKIATDNGI